MREENPRSYPEVGAKSRAHCEYCGYREFEGRWWGVFNGVIVLASLGKFICLDRIQLRRSGLGGRPMTAHVYAPSDYS